MEKRLSLFRQLHQKSLDLVGPWPEELPLSLARHRTHTCPFWAAGPSEQPGLKLGWQGRRVRGSTEGKNITQAKRTGAHPPEYIKGELLKIKCDMLSLLSQ